MMHIHRARKRFGQNFLQDERVIREIIAAIRPTLGDVIVEIGPGLGAMTLPLAKQVELLHVVEIDRDIIAYLGRLDISDKLVVHEGDVLAFDFSSIVGCKKIVGNLPYNISTPLLFHLCRYVDDVAEMHFMLQKEVVDRMVAIPGSSDYGRLSIMLQYFFEMESLFDVQPEAFTPAPKVQSAVVRMIPVPGRIGVAVDFDLFSRLVKQSFAHRRKTIRNNLKDWVSDEILEQVNIPLNARPEDLAPESFVVLSNVLSMLPE